MRLGHKRDQIVDRAMRGGRSAGVRIGGVQSDCGKGLGHEIVLVKVEPKPAPGRNGVVSQIRKIGLFGRRDFLEGGCFTAWNVSSNRWARGHSTGRQ